MAENDMTLGYLMGSDSNKDNGCCNNGGFGNGWGDFIWVILILAIFGYGGFGGYGGYGGGRGAGMGSGAVDGYVLTTDFANVERKIDTVQNGLCDGFYAMNTGMLNGFAGVNSNISNSFANLNTNLCQFGANVAAGQNATNVALMQSQNAISAQIADCCCTNRYESLQNANATQGAIRDGFCQTNYNNATNTRDIIEASAANTRAILDKLTQQEIAQKDAQIAAQNQALFAAELKASQEAQNSYLVNQLRPCPVPSYITCNPWASQAAYGSCGSCGC